MPEAVHEWHADMKADCIALTLDSMWLRRPPLLIGWLFVIDHIVANGNATVRVGRHERYRGDPLGYGGEADRVGVGGDIYGKEKREKGKSMVVIRGQFPKLKSDWQKATGPHWKGYGRAMEKGFMVMVWCSYYTC